MNKCCRCSVVHEVTVPAYLDREVTFRQNTRQTVDKWHCVKCHGIFEEDAKKKRGWLADYASGGKMGGLWLDMLGGVGDMLWRTAMIRELKRRNPELRIGVSNRVDPWREVFQNNPDITEIKDIDAEKIEGQYDRFFSDMYCPHVHWEDRGTKHALDIQQEWAGFEFEDRTYCFDLTEEEEAKADAYIKGLHLEGRVLVGLGINSSTAIRNWPQDRIDGLIRWLKDLGCVVFAFGGYHGGAFDPRDPDIINLYGGYSLRQLSGLLKRMNLVVTPDTGWLHIAGHFGVPTVALFGPIDSRVRASEYPTVGVIQGRPADTEGKMLEGCPCHAHHPLCPKKLGDPPPCMTAIKLSDVQAMARIIYPTLPPDPTKDVSVIMPVWNQGDLAVKAVESLIETHRKSAGFSYEIILFDNGSNEAGIQDKLTELKRKYPALKIMRSDKNLGFAPACNLGAKEAVGRWLLFLNTDTVSIQPGWLADFVRKADEKGDVIGQPKLLYKNLKVQCCGLEFDPRQMNFLHRMINRDRRDPELNREEMVQAATGACFLVRSETFKRLLGFDEGYQVGTFEDVDLCLRARKFGVPVWYFPSIEVIHLQSQSVPGGAHGPYFVNNWTRFKVRWVYSGELTQPPRIAVGIIAFNEEEYIGPCIQALIGHQLVKKIFIAEGAVNQCRDFAGPQGRSTDKTIEIIKGIPDPFRKIELLQEDWPDKDKMRQAIADRVNAGGFSHYLQVDADEIWHGIELEKLVNVIYQDPDLESVGVRPLEFWQNMYTIAGGQSWERFYGKPILFNLRKHGGIQFQDHLRAVGKDGKPFLHKFYQQIAYHHYGWVCSDEKAKQRIEYFRRRGTPGFKIGHDWIEQVWQGWKRDPLIVEAKFGTHPFGGGHTEYYGGQHPPTMQDHPRISEHALTRPKRLSLVGSAPRMDGWINVSLSGDGADIPQARPDKLPFNPGTLQEISANDVLEHFGQAMTPNLLRYWWTLLQPCGKLSLTTPNLRAVARGYVDGKLPYLLAVQNLYGLQSYAENFHGTLLEPDLLGQLLEAVGFREVVIDASDTDILMRATAYK